MPKAPNPVREARKKARSRRTTVCAVIAVIPTVLIMLAVHKYDHKDPDIALPGVVIFLVIWIACMIIGSWSARSRREPGPSGATGRARRRAREGW